MTDKEELREEIRQEIMAEHGTKYPSLWRGGVKATEIQNLIKSLNYVRLDEDQSLPENPYSFTRAMVDKKYYDEHIDYFKAQQDMLEAGFKKVKE